MCAGPWFVCMFKSIIEEKKRSEQGHATLYGTGICVCIRLDK